MFVQAAFMLVKTPSLQLICLNLSNTAAIIYQEYFRPKIENNNIEIINEVLVLIATDHLMLFTDFVPDVSDQYTIGWSLIAVIVIQIFFNLSLLVRSLFRTLRLML